MPMMLSVPQLVPAACVAGYTKYPLLASSFVKGSVKRIAWGGTGPPAAHAAISSYLMIPANIEEPEASSEVQPTGLFWYLCASHAVIWSAVRNWFGAVPQRCVL